MPNEVSNYKNKFEFEFSHSFFQDFTVDSLIYHVLGDNIDSSDIVNFTPIKLGKLELNQSVYSYYPNNTQKDILIISQTGNSCSKSGGCFSQKCYEKKQKCIITHFSGVFETTKIRKNIRLTNPTTLELHENKITQNQEPMNCDDPKLINPSKWGLT